MMTLPDKLGRTYEAYQQEASLGSSTCDRAGTNLLGSSGGAGLGSPGSDGDVQEQDVGGRAISYRQKQDMGGCVICLWLKFGSGGRSDGLWRK